MSLTLENTDERQATEIAGVRRELERLRQIEQRFEDFANSARDFAFITLDLHHRVTGWNKGAEQLLGYTEAEVLGRSADIFVTPEGVDCSHFEKAIATAREQGRCESESWRLRKDGSRFWANCVLTLLLDRYGEVHGYAKVMRDCTAQRKSIDALRASEERFRLLVENARDCALFSVDLRGNVSDWNAGAERIFGYAEEEVLGRSAPELLTSDSDAKRLMLAEFELAAVQDGASAECWLARQDGSRFYARWSTNAIRDETGHPVGFTKVLRDETDRKLDEEERERHSREQREVLEGRVRLTNLALHRTKEELQNLAGQILNAQDEERRSLARDLHDHLVQRLAFVEIKLSQLRSGFPANSATVADELEGIRGHVSKLSTEVRDLSHRLHPSTLEHIGLLAALSALVEEHQSVRKHRIELDIADYFDEGLPAGLRSVLYRISEEALRNIQRHAGDVPVTLTLYRDPDYVHLDIHDGGPGFSRDAIKPFKQRRPLGLISMEERARLVGGTLEVTSRPDHGTTIRVAVPLRRGPDEVCTQ